MDHRALARAAASQHGLLFTAAQAGDAGLSRAMSRRVASGEWARVHPACRGGRCTGKLGATGARRGRPPRAGEGTVASHRTAARLWGLVDRSGRLEITIPLDVRSSASAASPSTAPACSPSRPRPPEPASPPRHSAARCRPRRAPGGRRRRGLDRSGDARPRTRPARPAQLRRPPVRAGAPPPRTDPGGPRRAVAGLRPRRLRPRGPRAGRAQPRRTTRTRPAAPVPSA